VRGESHWAVPTMTAGQSTV